MSLLDEFFADVAEEQQGAQQLLLSNNKNQTIQPNMLMMGSTINNLPQQPPAVLIMTDDDTASTTTTTTNTTDEASSSGMKPSLNQQRYNSAEDHDALSTTSSMSTFSSGSTHTFNPLLPPFTQSMPPFTPSFNAPPVHIIMKPQPPVVTVFHPNSFSSMLHDQAFNEHMFKIREYMSLSKSGHGKALKTGASLQEDEEYPYILASNAYTLQIDQEIDRLFIQLKGLYAEKFKDLESNVSDPLSFVQTVLRIGNGVPLVASRNGSQSAADIDLSDILPPSTIMILKVTAVNEGTFRQNLSEDKWAKIEQLCKDIIQLDDCKETILEYVSTRMTYVAPNLSALVGTRIAAQLIGSAGGLASLSQTAADAIQCLGREKKKLEGLSSRTYMGMMSSKKRTSNGAESSQEPTYALSFTANDFSHMRYTGFVGLSDLVMQHCPPRENLRKKVSRSVSTKCALAARVDNCNSAKDGSEGKKLREDVMIYIKKLLEPPKRREDKPLPAPDSIKKTTRGGGKSAFEKEISRMSELRKKQARLAFGEEGDDDSYLGEGLGMLGKGDTKKGLGMGQSLRLHQAILSSGKRYEHKSKKNKQQSKGPLGASSSVNPAVSASNSAFFDGISTLSSNSIFKSGTATQIIRTGTATSMAINNQNEMEILNPNLVLEEEKKKAETKKTGYFSFDAKFKKSTEGSSDMAPPSDRKKNER